MGTLPRFHPSAVPDSPRRLVPRRPGAMPSALRRSGSEPESPAELARRSALAALTMHGVLTDAARRVLFGHRR
jgi:hypothetical protein